MSRLDNKTGGRFDSNLETLRILDGMDGWQENYGDYVDYYRLNESASQWDDVFEEAIEGGVVFDGPFRLACWHVTHVRGGNEYSDTGFYYNDSVSAITSYRHYTHTGMSMADIDTGRYMKDRLVYDQKVFKITEIAVRGQIQQRDIIIAIQATQVKPDELMDSPQFARYGENPTP